MKLIECSNGYLIYEYNNGTAMTMDALYNEDVQFFPDYLIAYGYTLPF